MKKLELLIPPPLVMLVVGFLMWLLAIAAPALSFSWPKNLITIGVLLALGIIIGMVGIYAFKSAATTIDPKKPEQASILVTSGIYNYSRNPMYLGVLVLLLAWLVYLGNFLSLIGPTVFVIYINRFQIGPEERILETKFGTNYQAYKKKVRRWI